MANVVGTRAWLLPVDPENELGEWGGGWGVGGQRVDNKWKYKYMSNMFYFLF